MDCKDSLEKTGPSRRDIVVLAAGAGAAMALTPMPMSSLNAAQPTAKPVAFVWMGQVMLDPTAQETPYIPPASYGPHSVES